MKYFTGALASTPDARDFDFHKSEIFAGASPVEIRDYDFRHLHRWRIQQGPSCVEYSLVAKIQALAIALGKPLDPLCANLLWWGARNYASPPGTAITGSSCRLAIKYARDRKVKPDYVYPDRPENQARVPPADVLEAPGIVRPVSFHRIYGEGNPDRLRSGILTAFSLLASGGQCSFPSAVMPVGSGYAQLEDGEAWDGTIGEPWGNHDQAIGLYRASDDCVGFLSSWPKNPGDTEESENALGVDGGRVFWVPITVLAEMGFEFWVIDRVEFG